MAIISFHHDLIFIKTTKTAGTSIEVDLSRFVEAEAIVTPILPPVPGHEARNFVGQDGQPLYFNHQTASAIRNQLGVERFAQMTVFCVEREPVEKCISHFHMLRNSPLHNRGSTYELSWDGYIQAGVFPIDIAKYTDGPLGARKLMVDRILRYDRLEPDLAALLAEHGIRDFKLTAKAKSEYARNRLISPQDVTSKQQAIIYRAFRETLDISGILWGG